MNTTLNCHSGSDKYVTLVGVLLATSDRSINDLLRSLEKWISEKPEVKLLDGVIVDPDCSVRIQSTVNSTCVATQVGGVSPSTSPQSSGATVNGLAAGLVIFAVIATALLIVVVVLIVVLVKKHHSVG